MNYPIHSIQSVTKFRQNIFEMIDEINTSGDALVLTKNGSAQAVVLSYEEFDSLMETFDIMRDPKTYKELKEAQKSNDYVPFEHNSNNNK